MLTVKEIKKLKSKARPRALRHAYKVYNMKNTPEYKMIADAWLMGYAAYAQDIEKWREESINKSDQYDW